MDSIQDLRDTLDLDRDDFEWYSESEDESDSGSSYHSMSDLEVYNEKLDLGALVFPQQRMVMLLVEGSAAGLDSQNSAAMDSAALETEQQPQELAPTAPWLTQACKDKIAAGSLTWFFKLAMTSCASDTTPAGPSSAGTRWLSVVPDFLPEAVITAATSAGGLICCLLNSDVAPLLAVVNPITGTWQPVPDPPFEDVNFLSMTYEDSTKAYRLFVTSHHDVVDYAEREKLLGYKVYDDSGEEPVEVFLCLTTCVYDSARRAWGTTKHAVPLDFSHIVGSITSCRGRNYWLAESRLYGHTVICYDDQHTLWLRLHFPECSLVTRHSEQWSNPYISCNLTELEGNLFLAAEVHNDEGKSGVCIRIWKLNHEGETWDVPQTIQSEVYLKLLPRHHRGFIFAGHGENIWMVVRGTPVSLLYNLSTSVMHQFPACPFALDYSEEGECFHPTSAAYAFQPRLDNAEEIFSGPAK